MTGDLLTMLRDHDLPPKWDGLVTVWEPWDTTPTERRVFVCPPPKDAAKCEGCGSTAVQHETKGRVALSSVVTRERIAYEDANRARLGRSALGHRKQVAAVRLFAWRCPDCLLDTVWDTDTNDMYVLEHDDYSDEGA